MRDGRYRDEARQRLSNGSKQVPGPLLTSIPRWVENELQYARWPRKTAGFWLQACVARLRDEKKVEIKQERKKSLFRGICTARAKLMLTFSVIEDNYYQRNY